MPHKIALKLGVVSLNGTLNDSAAAQALAKRLPLEFSVSRWGQEFYGSVPDGLEISDETGAVDLVDKGALAFWPPGEAFCVFWGKTPASRGDECRPASPVLVIGSVDGDWKAVDKLGGSINVKIEKV